MKRNLIFLPLFAFFSCIDRYDPTGTLTKHQVDSLLFRIAIYTEKEPDEYEFQFEDRFKPEYSGHYFEKANDLTLELIFRKDTLTYYCTSKLAPSLFGERRATGGIIYSNKEGEIVDFDIHFVTYRTKPDVLKGRIDELFKELVSKGSLDKFPRKEEYVEWPSGNVFYDKQTYDWKIIPQ